MSDLFFKFSALRKDYGNVKPLANHKDYMHFQINSALNFKRCKKFVSYDKDSPIEFNVRLRTNITLR
jgi:hypothetical protein